MQLCFITQDEKSCRPIIDKLEPCGCLCRITDSWLSLFKSLQKKDCRIDMIVSDFKYMARGLFNLFESIRELGMKIPVIFYNDPFPFDSERIPFWIRLNEMSYKSVFPSECIRILSVLNEAIAAVHVQKPAAHPGSSVLLPDFCVDSCKEIDMGEFRARSKLSPVLFRLFEFMYKNRAREIPLEEIGGALFTEKKSSVHSSVVYSYISRLRAQLECGSASRVRIIRSSAGCYKMVVLGL